MIKTKKFTGKLLSLALSICMMTSCLPISAFAALSSDVVDENYDDFVKIYDADDLSEFADQATTWNTGANAILMCDITVNPGTFDEDGNYTPKDDEELKYWYTICNVDDNPYTGTFDGNGHTISGLCLLPSDYYGGFFGYLGTSDDSVGCVKNLKITNSYFGTNHDAKINTIYSATFVGYNDGGKIENCVNDAIVSGPYYVGGIAGVNKGGVIAFCENTGIVKTEGEESTVCIGGIVASNQNGSLTDAIVEGCCNTGNVSTEAGGSTAKVGGIVGENLKSDNNGDGEIKVLSCFNTGTVSSGDDSCYGAIVGENADQAQIENCYYLSDSETDELDGTTAKTSSHFKSGEVTYLLNQYKTTADFFQTIGTDDIPTLNSESGTVYLTADKLHYSNIENDENIVHIQDDNGYCEFCNVFCDVPKLVTEENATEAEREFIGYYAIENANQLNWFASEVNSGNTAINGFLTNAIILNGYFDEHWQFVCYDEEDCVEFTPIGNKENPYIGTFNGQNYGIYGLYINQPDSDYVGLFGAIGHNDDAESPTSANIMRVNVQYGTFCGNKNVGAVVGGVIVNGKGGSPTVNIKECSAYANEVSGDEYVGGIVGGVYDDTFYGTNKYTVNIDTCGTHSTISATSGNVGGVVGYILINYKCGKAVVTNCSSESVVTSLGNCVGGILGCADSHSGRPTDVTITKCRNDAGDNTSISGDRVVGGIVGKIFNGTVSECYNNNGTVYGNNGVGGIVGEIHYGRIEKCYTSERCTIKCVATTDESGGTIKSTYIGGIVGCAVKKDSAVVCCYSKATVSGKYFVGGIAGSGYNVQSCYNTGDVSGTSYVSPIVAETDSTNPPVNCCYYDDSETLGEIDEYSGTTRLDLSQFKSGEAAYLLNGKTSDSDKVCWYQDIEIEDFPYFPDDHINDIHLKIVYYGFVTSDCSQTNQPVYTNDPNVLESKSDHGAYQYEPCGNGTHNVNCQDCGDVLEANATCTYIGNRCRYCGYECEHESVSNDFCNTCGMSTKAITPNEDGLYEIYDVAQLYWFAQQVNYNYAEYKGILMADIKVNPGTFTESGDYISENGETPLVWEPIANSYGQYYNTFDGNNHTVSGLYCDQESGYVGFFGNLGPFEVKNLRIANSYFKGAYAGAIAGYANGSILTQCAVSSDVYVNGDNYAGGIFANGDGTIENCYSQAAVSAKTYGGLSGYNATIINSYTTSKRPTGNPYNNTLTDVYYLFDDGDYTTPDENGYVTVKPVFEGATEVTEAQFKSGEVAYLLSQNVRQIDAVYEYEYDESGEITNTTLVSEAYTPDIWKQTLGKQDYPNFDGKKVYLMINTGCAYAPAKYSNTIDDTYCAEHESFDNGFCKCGAYYQPCEGDGTQQSPYLIANGGNLYWFAEHVKSIDSDDIYAKLTDDITVNENVVDENGTLSESADTFKTWTPIVDYAQYQFLGNFDGNCKKISGLYCAENGSERIGFFAVIGSSAKVYDLTIADSYFEGTTYIGAITGYAYSDLQNCHNLNTTIVASDCESGNDDSAYTSFGSCAGGIVGYTSCCITGCTNTGTISGNTHIGGIVGELSTSANINSNVVSNCKNSGEISGNNYIGGILGYCYNYDIATTITMCENSGKISGNNNAGGIVGCSYTEDNITDLNNCTNNGEIRGEYSIGGIAGCSHASITNCVNNGAVSGVAETAYNMYSIDTAGGIAGLNHGNISNCTNNADISGVNVIGGIAGYSNTSFDSSDIPNIYIENCDNYGKISSKNITVGGIVGDNKKCDVKNCKNYGDVCGEYYIGGIAGQNGTEVYVGDPSQLTGCIENCKNYGTVYGYEYYIGGIVGDNSSKIENCQNHGEIKLSNADNHCLYIGGIAGICEKYASVIGCENYGSIPSDLNADYVGGIVGYGYNYVEITECANKGAITIGGDNESLYIGGIAGSLNLYSTVTNCYNNAAITAPTGWYVGGLIGFSAQPESSDDTEATPALINCYNSGKINANAKSWYGALAGAPSTCINVTNCYYLDTTCDYVIAFQVSAIDNAFAMTAKDFASGKVAYLLNYKNDDVYRQNFNSDDDKDMFPSLDGPLVKYNEETETYYNFGFAGASLTLQDSLAMNFYVALPNDIYYDDTKQIDATFVIENSIYPCSAEYDIDNGYIIYTVSDLLPNQLNDNITATFYISDMDDPTVWEYSISEYLYTLLEDCALQGNTELSQLIVELLGYGAASQIYTQHSTDDLANSALTPAQAAYGLDDDIELSSILDPKFESSGDGYDFEVLESPQAVWKSVGLNLEESFTMRAKFVLDSDIDISNVTVKAISYMGERIIEASEFIKSGENEYYVFFDEIFATQIAMPVYFTVYIDDNAISNTLRYSVESYAYLKQNSENTALADLVKAIARYGYCAATYQKTINPNNERRFCNGLY